MRDEILKDDGKLDAAELTWLAANYPAQKITVLWSDGKLMEQNARHALKTIKTISAHAPVAVSLTVKAKLRLMLDATPAPRLP